VVQPPAKKQVVCRKIPQKAFKGKNYAKDRKIPSNYLKIIYKFNLVFCFRDSEKFAAANEVKKILRKRENCKCCHPGKVNNVSAMHKGSSAARA
jgi:hypothetical protein